MNGDTEYDVVIVGGGPVGLLLAYQLKRFGTSVCVLEQHDKQSQDAYGRAIALFPRTLEMLDQLDLIEPMLQLGFACRTSVTYKDGERVLPGRVWTFMENIQDTSYDFVLVIRQMYTEQILRDKLSSIGVAYYQATECIDFRSDEKGVVSTFKNRATGQTFGLKSKYLVGADGGRSFVRRQAGIPFEGDTSDDKWIRIDGIVETDMPISRSYGAIESKTHGNVLWAPLDHGATRIGYAYSSQIASKYPDGVTQEVAEKEAIESMKPFNVTFKEIHWWTLYSIGQRIAKTFSTQDRIFLCGDAAHTHSSGAAQGLNTGIHDAVNLAWKLALHIRGVTNPAVLQTYSTERMSAVQQLIEYDKDISILMSHKWPTWYTGDRNADPYIVLGTIFEKAASFNTGLGISYTSNHLNRLSEFEGVRAGSRPPDVEMTMPGTGRKVRFQEITRNLAKFWAVVFTGDISITRMRLLQLRKELDTKEIFNGSVGWITVSAAAGCSPYEALGMDPLGILFFDLGYVAHQKFGLESGGIVIIRPDGLVSAGGSIEGAWVRDYFSSVLQ
ncbi:hypothetical protein N7528_008885 [Penicillium herquei]|nr:hypothetical protein N7528_008885 [Penicillium herquei]